MAVKSAPVGEVDAEVKGGQADAEGGDADAEVRDKLMQKLIALGWHAPPPTSRAMPVESAPLGEADAAVKGGNADAEDEDADAGVTEKLIQTLITLG